MSTTSNELDLILKRSLVLLHLSQPSSAMDLRNLLDDEIRQRYGTEKMLINRLEKKHLEQESTFPGRAPTPPVEIINLINSPTKTISDSPNTILDSEDANECTQDTVSSVTMITSNLMTEGSGHYDETATSLRDFGDLNCCVCSEMMFTASNRLIECSKCGSLYHQACHKPAITASEISDELLANWLCDQCLNKPSTTKEADVIIIPHGTTITLEEPTTSNVVATVSQSSMPPTSHMKSTCSISSPNSSLVIYRSDQNPPPPAGNTSSKLNIHSSTSGLKSQSSNSASQPSSSSSSSSRRHSSASSNASTNSKSRVTRQYESRKRSHK